MAPNWKFSPRFSRVSLAASCIAAGVPPARLVGIRSVAYGDRRLRYLDRVEGQGHQPTCRFPLPTPTKPSDYSNLSQLFTSAMEEVKDTKQEVEQFSRSPSPGDASGAEDDDLSVDVGLRTWYANTSVHCTSHRRRSLSQDGRRFRLLVHLCRVRSAFHFRGGHWLKCLSPGTTSLS